jgi:hypothetical protein
MKVTALKSSPPSSTRVGHLAAFVVSKCAEQEPGREGGDEDAAAERGRDPDREQRRRRTEDLLPMRLDQTAARREAQREPSEDSRGDAAHEPVADLLEHELDGRVVGDRPALSLGERDRDEEQRDAEPVIEAALDVQSLPDPGGDPLVGDDRLSERRVGAGEHDGKHERLGEADPGQDHGPRDHPHEDRERQADAEQPQRNGELAPQRRKRDPRRVREQHQCQGDLREPLDELALDLEVEQSQDGPDEQAGGREEHRAGHVEQLQPP